MEALFLFGLIVKHAIVDVGIQRHLGYQKKHIYFSPRAQLHYLGHGIGTFLVLCLGGIYIALIAGIIDYIAHWHIDCTKTRINNRFELAQADLGYWWLLTVDQLLHYSTYFLIIYFLYY
jgi:hypothetical protein